MTKCNLAACWSDFSSKNFVHKGSNGLNWSWYTLTVASRPRLSAVWWLMRGLLLMMASVSSLSAQCLLSKVLWEGYLSPLETPKDIYPSCLGSRSSNESRRANTINGFPVGKTRNPMRAAVNPSLICKQNMSDHQVSNPHSSEVDGVWIALITFIMFGHFLQLQHPNNIPNSLKLPTANH